MFLVCLLNVFGDRNFGIMFDILDVVCWCIRLIKVFFELFFFRMLFRLNGVGGCVVFVFGVVILICLMVLCLMMERRFSGDVLICGLSCFCRMESKKFLGRFIWNSGCSFG